MARIRKRGFYCMVRYHLGVCDMDYLTKDERETVIRYCEADDTITVTTGVLKHKRWCEKQGYELVQVGMLGDKPVTWQFKAPVGHFQMPKPKRRVSEKQREAARKRAKALFGKGEDD